MNRSCPNSSVTDPAKSDIFYTCYSVQYCMAEVDPLDSSGYSCYTNVVLRKVEALRSSDQDGMFRPEGRAYVRVLEQEVETALELRGMVLAHRTRLTSVGCEETSEEPSSIQGCYC